ncbi:Tim44/TimA family putative adaptor protein [Oceanibacterium hippocampi]|uniref:Tim44-like domain protein n=1 Tax=Oceanibacterium hippocampi TaxID=745714 RepID=A0A1Y5RP33_9PROT|nr:Tim44/TimA family putative adaptor protein [Oceanibacterium hippocampi]SLN21011.1 Tim44-like domain protein [Oceanibacterium hippocampi]
MQYLDIILLAMVAAFIFLRLRSVLGKRTGHEQPPPERYSGKPLEDDAATDEKVVKLPHRKGSQDTLSPELRAVLTRVHVADRGFDEAHFMQGAQWAYETIVNGFAKGDREALRPLLTDDVFASFNAAIEAREAAGHDMHTEITDYRSAEIEEATFEDNVADITVRFVTEMVTFTKNSDGVVISGDPTTGKPVIDIWTFRRDTGSKDPTWYLSATRSET